MSCILKEKMWITVNEGKSVLGKEFIRIFKKKFYKYMTSISKNFDSDKLDYIANKYSYTIKMKHIDVNSSIYIDFSAENDVKGSKLKDSNHVRISECKNIFAKAHTPNWSKKDFVKS